METSGGVVRKKGSGHPATRRTVDNVANAKNAFAEASDVMRETGRTRGNVRNIITNSLELHCLRKIKTQRVVPRNQEQGLAACEKWRAEIECGSLDLTQIFWMDEKAFRPDKNAPKKPKKIPNNLIFRVGDTWQGRATPGMVPLWHLPCRRGGIEMRPVRLEIQEKGAPGVPGDRHRFSGAPPSYAPKQDAASSQEAKIAQEAKIPQLLGEKRGGGKWAGF